LYGKNINLEGNTYRLQISLDAALEYLAEKASKI